MATYWIPAFHWLCDRLEELHVPFAISGGLAARIYGATREVADIDLSIRGADLAKLAREFSPFVLSGPAHHLGDLWDIQLLTLDYEGQLIEIGTSTHSIRDRTMEQWIAFDLDPSGAVIISFEDRPVPVIPLELLIKYKSILRRPEDLEDIEEMTATSTRDA